MIFKNIRRLPSTPIGSLWRPIGEAAAYQCDANAIIFPALIVEHDKDYFEPCVEPEFTGWQMIEFGKFCKQKKFQEIGAEELEEFLKQ